MINVFVLTYCRHLELFYGTELIFKTLRVGFPNAKVTVVDNGSLPEAAAGIESLSKQNDCCFELIPAPGIQHHNFIENTIRATADEKRAGGPLIFVDPDVCFWESCEDFDFDGLIAGKMCNGFHEAITQTFAMPRLHSSFLWIPSAEELMRVIRQVRAVRFDFEPFQPYSCVINGTWIRFDTGANLCNALADKLSAFTEDHLNRFDHIFCGSHFDLVYPRLDKRVQEMMGRIHACAKQGDLESLKGIWRYVEDVMRPSWGVATIPK
jgi:hypothetical protein